jgi:adenylate kinase
MINLVLFGPPGSGKGTQSEKLIEKYGLTHFSTGDILRGEITAKSELGIKAQAYMDCGELVPDKDVIAMVIRNLDKHKRSKGFIFDGFPRTKPQARFLRNELTERDMRINLMISLEVEKDELVKRLVKRGEKSGRSDDEQSIIEKRIEIYHRQSAPIKEFYKMMHKFAPIEGKGGIDDIFMRICEAVEKSLA